MSGTHHDLEEHGHEGVSRGAEAARYAVRIRAIEHFLSRKAFWPKETYGARSSYEVAHLSTERSSWPGPGSTRVQG